MGGTYTVTVTDNSCSATATTTVVVNTNAYTWAGASTDWTASGNWSPAAPAGGPSGCNVSVVIPATGTYPVISSAVSIGNVTINDNAQLTLNANLSTCGNFVGGTSSAASVKGTGSLILNGTGAQSISGVSTFTVLEIDKTSRSVTSTGTLSINTALQLTQGNFTNSGGTVTLISNASGDAYLDDFTSGTAGTYSGNLTVQRYVSNTANGYRDISSPVSTTVSDLNNAYAVTGQNGVDCWYAYSPYPNLQRFDESLVIAAANGNYFEHWVSYTSLSNPLTAMLGLAFRTYVGAAYTISFTGAPYTGAKSATITDATDGWNLIGNPYPSPIK